MLKYNTTYTIFRVTTVSGKQTYEATGTTVRAFEQPLSGEAIAIDDTLVNVFTAYCDVNADIKEGDKVTDGTNTAFIRAVATRNYGLKHKTLKVVRVKE